MKKRMAWRYTCEHCGKSGASGGHISKHERFCTKNPQRDCRMCRMVGNEPKPVAELLAAVDYKASDAGFTSDETLYRELDLTRVRELCGGCPACLLAVVRQSKNEDGVCIIEEGFSWNTERDQWMEDYRASMIPCGFMGEDVKFDRNEWDERRAERKAAP